MTSGVTAFSAVNGPPGTKRIMKNVAVRMMNRTGIVSRRRRAMKRSTGKLRRKNHPSRSANRLRLAARSLLRRLEPERAPVDHVQRIAATAVHGRMQEEALVYKKEWREGRLPGHDFFHRIKGDLALGHHAGGVGRGKGG